MKYLHLLFIVLLFPSVSHAYYPLSPYSYCGGEPVNCVDPTGNDIVVLNYGNGANQHLAMLIQNEKGKWQYYSVNGNNMYIPFINIFTGGRPFNDVGVGSWNSPQEFLNSSYNVRNDVSKEDKSMNNFGFSEGYQITSTPGQDAIMRENFTKIANTTYKPITNNCAIAVQQVMIDAGISVSKPNIVPTSTIPMQTPFGMINVINGYQIKYDMHFLPSSAFKSIMEWNPGGQYLHK